MGIYFLTYGDMLFYVGGYAFYLLSKNQKFFIWIKYRNWLIKFIEIFKY